MNLRRTFIIAATGLLTGSAFAGTPERLEIDQVFADYDSTRSPGCSMAIYRDGEIAYARGYGIANLEYGIANGPDTVFRIASVSKQFTAMAIALLAEQGALSLDDDIHKFFPEMPDYGEPVTIRQLIHHTSWLRDYLTLAWLADWTEDFSVDEALQIIVRQQELNFPPGTEHLYSNTGYFLLSQIVQIVTDQTLSEWAGENMFRPLGMTKTHFHDDHTHIVKNRADGYEATDDDRFKISMTILDMVGDGGIYTTVNDLLKWDQNFYDNQLGHGGPELIELVQTPGKLDNGDELNYAFGLGIGEYRGTREIRHGGGFVGFRSGLNRYPDYHLSVAVLCNYADTNPTGLARSVASLFLSEKEDKGDSTDQVEAQPNEVSDVVEVSVTDLERLVGDYWHAEDLTLRSIVIDDDSLFYSRGGENRTRLDPLGNGRFLMADVSAVVNVRFEPLGEKPQAMIVEVEGEEPFRLKSFDRAAPSEEELLAYVGSYYSDELGYVLVLRSSGEMIVADRRSENIPFRPLQKDIFIADTGVVLMYERNSDGGVSGLRLNAGRVRNVKFIRQ